MLVTVLALLSAASGSMDEHLLLGARAFRDGRYEEALAEFRVAEKLGAGPDARGYAAASLVKLNRPDEALELFGASAGEDPVLEFYRAVACHQARLLTCADRTLAATEDRFGPRVAEEARALRAEIRKTLSVKVRRGNVDWYLAKARRSLRAGRLVLGSLCAQEALALGSRRKDCHGCAEARALETRARAALAALGSRQP